MSNLSAAKIRHSLGEGGLHQKIREFICLIDCAEVYYIERTDWSVRIEKAKNRPCYEVLIICS